jgi:glycosyltransferase involved in cell wall biosynthesis
LTAEVFELPLNRIAEKAPSFAHDGREKFDRLNMGRRTARWMDELSATIVGNGGSGECSVTVHAVLPPPVTGMTLCTAAMADALARRVDVTRYNWSSGGSAITPWFRLMKAGRSLASPWKLLLGRRTANAVFYMPNNGGYAMFYNIVAVAAARLRGYRCAIHHHFYRYLEQFDWRLKLLDRVLGPSGLHVVLCSDMEERLRRLYSCRASIAIVPSTFQLLDTEIARMPAPAPATVSGEPFRIGHISNLQIAKGLDLAIEVLRVLRGRGRNVHLVLAGPTLSNVEREMIEAARAEFGDNLDYRGPVYGDEKLRFFQDIDCKLFPTRYPDAQPLVITEAFAFGRPVISYGRGCIPGMIGNSLNWSVAVGDDFAQPAVELIEQWMDDSGAYSNASRAARLRFESMLGDARDALEQFVDWVKGEPDRGFVHRGQASEMNELCEAS